jgi:hypothetical protein
LAFRRGALLSPLNGVHHVNRLGNLTTTPALSRFQKRLPNCARTWRFPFNTAAAARAAELDEAEGATPASPPNIGRVYSTAHWGATPCIKLIRAPGLDVPILNPPTSIFKTINAEVKTKSRAAKGRRARSYRGTGEPIVLS